MQPVETLSEESNTNSQHEQEEQDSNTSPKQQEQEASIDLNALFQAPSIDLNDPFSLYYSTMLSNRNELKPCTIRKIRFPQNSLDERPYLEEISTKIGHLPFSLNMGMIKTISFEFSDYYKFREIIEKFISELFDCDDQLFHKFMCYFKSPTRMYCKCRSKASLMLGDALISLRECCKKCNSSSTQSTPIEKLGWISQFLKESNPITTLPQSNKMFKFNESFHFTSDNMKFCDDRQHLFGFECDDCFSNKSINQLLFSLPSMFELQITKAHQNVPDGLYSSFTFDNERILLNSCVLILLKGVFDESHIQTMKEQQKPLSSIQLSIEKDFRKVWLRQNVSEFKYTCQDMIRAFVFMSLQSQAIYPDDNVCFEIIKFATLKKQKQLSMQSLYEFLFNEFRNKKYPKPKPSENQKELVKKRSLSILKDITNIQHRNVINAMNVNNQQKSLPITKT